MFVEGRVRTDLVMRDLCAFRVKDFGTNGASQICITYTNIMAFRAVVAGHV